MNRIFFATALLFSALVGCEKITGGLGLEHCAETGVACDGSILTVCEEGLPVVKIDCAGAPEDPSDDLLCNASLGQCDLCGNGVVDAGEQCDTVDANGGTNIDCLPTCQLAAICGDGDVGPGEVCDDGNVVAGDGCRADCSGIEACGDGLVDVANGELCDDGNNTAGDGCRSDCQGFELCGDGFVDPGEDCDDGNNTAGDGCRADCKGAEICGDNFVDSAKGEVCDDGNTLAGDGCRADCLGVEICGDGKFDAGEQCDDGNNISGDGCQFNCLNPRCGDGLVDPNEQCDDGNANNNDSCNNACIALNCGNAVLNAGEVCDDNNTVSGDGCRSDCLGLEICGDLLIDSAKGEQCDDGNNVNTDACTNTCLSAFCGDGITRAGVEQCDDGNNVNTDACTNGCLNAFCGDGITRAGVEQCDDGNTNNNDGCSNTCIAATCGNGIIEGSEECDDQNTTNGDGCSAVCAFENVTNVNCNNASAELNTIITNAANNSTIKVTGTCNSSDFNAPAIINNSIVIIGQGNNAKIDTSLGGALFEINGGSVAIVNLEIINTNSGNGAKTIKCVGGPKALLDRLTIRNQAGDRGISVENTCSMIISNTVIAGSTSSNKDTIQMKDSPKLDIIFSTFLSNSPNTEQAIVEAAGQCRFDSVVGFDNGNAPTSGTITGLNPTTNSFSFIKDLTTLSGNQDVDPKINSGGANIFRLQNTSPAINSGNTSLDLTKLNFNPVTEFGLNPYAHDRLGAPRVKSGRADAGAFEDF